MVQGKGYLKVDDEFAKKVQTNAITKGLSALGFNSDVFEGKFDDNKYVNEMKEKHGTPKPANRTPVKKKDDKPYAKDIDDKTVEMVKEMGWTQAQCLKHWNECGATKAEFAEAVRINHESTTELPI